jgi:hypothetical protein
MNGFPLLTLLALGFGSRAASAGGPQADLSTAAHSPQAADTALDGSKAKQDAVPAIEGAPVSPPSSPRASAPKPVAAAAVSAPDPAAKPPTNESNTADGSAIFVIGTIVLAALVVLLLTVL